MFMAGCRFAGWRSRELLGHDVAVSPDFGPAAVGLIHAQIVLPEWVFDLPMEEQHLVLRHEARSTSAPVITSFFLLELCWRSSCLGTSLALWWQLQTAGELR